MLHGSLLSMLVVCVCRDWATSHFIFHIKCPGCLIVDHIWLSYMSLPWLLGMVHLHVVLVCVVWLHIDPDCVLAVCSIGGSLWLGTEIWVVVQLL